MHKPQPTAKLLTLPPEEETQLAAWLLDGMPYHLARERVAKEFGLQITSDRPFSEFWKRVCVPELVARRNRAMETAQEIVRNAAKKPARFNSATLELLQQKVFELVSHNADPKDLKDLFSMVLNAEKHQLNKDRLAARERLEKRAAARERKDQPSATAAEAGLDDDSKARINAIREQLFGELPPIETEEK